jgi:hypothetical protein
MLRTVCIVIAAVSTACGGGTDQAHQSGKEPSQPGRPSSMDQSAVAAPGNTNSSTPSLNDASTGGGTPSTDQLVSVIGCLQGNEDPRPLTGTVGRTSTAETARSSEVAEGAGANQFLLRRARPAPGGEGVGANGAGGSGGPLVSGISDYRLEGSAVELRPHLNHEVRINARLNPRETSADTSRAASGPSNAAPETPGAGATSANRASSGSRLLVVESVQMVAPTCPQP